MSKMKKVTIESPMRFISGLNHVALPVNNIEESKKFYCDILGLEFQEKYGNSLFLKAGNDILALLENPSSEKINPQGKGKKNAHFGFYAPSREKVTEFAEHLRQHDIVIIEGPYDRSDGCGVYFMDPNGYTLEYLFYEEKKEGKPELPPPFLATGMI